MDTINVCLGLFSVHYQLKINFKADFSRSESHYLPMTLLRKVDKKKEKRNTFRYFWNMSGENTFLSAFLLKKKFAMKIIT
jgi:hypothetical protein